MPSLSRTFSAFTLLELLVIILIIAVLGAMLIPVISKSRAQSKMVACSANLRQVGLALLEYKSESHDFPQAIWMPPPFGLPDGKSALNLTISTYISVKNKIYRCPNDVDQFYDACAEASVAGAGISYAYWYRNRPLLAPSVVRITDLDGFMTDFGADVNLRGVTRSLELHPGPKGTRGGGNVLNFDGSVMYELPKETREPSS